MTSKDRLMASLKLGIPDRVPFLPRHELFALKYAGFHYTEALHDCDKWVRAQVQALEDFHCDSVWDSCTAALFGELWGGRIILFDDDPPANEPFVESIDQLAQFDKRPDFSKSPFLKTCLNTVTRLKKAVGDEIPVIGLVPMPFRFLTVARGIENAMLDLVLNPDLVCALQEYYISIATRYVEALVEAGSDLVVLFNPAASKNCISRKHYEQFVHPYSKYLFQELKERNIMSIYHTCGDWSDRIDLVAEEGAECLWIDGTTTTDLAVLKHAIGSKVCIMGNVHVVNVLLEGTPEEVVKETRRCLDKGSPGGGYILSGNCLLPRDVPPSNLYAMETACREFGQYN